MAPKRGDGRRMGAGMTSERRRVKKRQWKALLPPGTAGKMATRNECEKKREREGKCGGAKILVFVWPV